MKEEHIEERARASEESIHVNGDLILLIFPGVLLAIIVLKKIWKTENSLSVLQSSVLFAQSYMLRISKAKSKSFSFFRKKRHCSFKILT